MPDAAAERIDLDGPKHLIEIAVHPEQVIALPVSVGASTTDIRDERSDEIELGENDRHPFGQI